MAADHKTWILTGLRTVGEADAKLLNARIRAAAAQAAA